MLPASWSAAKTAHTGAACRAYKSAFYRDDKNEFANSGLTTRNRDTLFHFHRNLGRETRLDRVHFPHRHAFFRRDQGDRFVVMRFKLADLFALLEIRRDRFARERAHFAE